MSIHESRHWILQTRSSDNVSRYKWNSFIEFGRMTFCSHNFICSISSVDIEYGILHDTSKARDIIGLQTLQKCTSNEVAIVRSTANNYLTSSSTDEVIL